MPPTHPPAVAEPLEEARRSLSPRARGFLTAVHAADRLRDRLTAVAADPRTPAALRELLGPFAPTAEAVADLLEAVAATAYALKAFRLSVECDTVSSLLEGG